MSKYTWHSKTSLLLIQIFALFFLIPFQANAATPSWQGVWGGTIGKSNVIVCLDDSGNSAYRYQRYQADIPLSHLGDKWQETINGVVSGIWSLSEAQGDALEGNWQNPKTQRTLPISLKKISGTNGVAPCESLNYKSGVTEDFSVANAPSAAEIGNSSSSKHSEYVYVVNGNDHTISAYRINSDTGVLTPILGSPLKAGNSPSYIVVNPAGTFAYVLNDAHGAHDKHYNAISDSISAYRIDASTGVLIPIPGKLLKTGVGSVSATIDPTGAFVYVASGRAEDGTIGNLAVFRIDAASGELAPVKKYALDLLPVAIVINPAGTFAYVEFNAGIKTYRINSNTGELIETKLVDVQLDGDIESIFGVRNVGDPACITMNPAGTFMYVAYGSENSQKHGLSVYRVNATTGELTLAPKISFELKSVPKSFTLNRTGTYAYMVMSGLPSAVLTYRVNASTGELSMVEGGKFDMEDIYADSIMLNHTGRFAYVLSQKGIANGVVSAFRTDTTTGKLSPLNDNPFRTIDTPEYITVNPAGTFAYVTNSGPHHIAAHPQKLNAASGDISIFSINPNTGVLKLSAQRQLLQTGYGPIKINSSGTFAYQFNDINSTIIVHSVSASTGALTPVVGSPFKIRHSPSQVVFNPAGTIVYALNRDNSVSGYRISAATGELTQSFDSKMLTNPIFFTIHPTGAFAYVVSSDGAVLTYRVSPTGELAAVPGNPYIARLHPVSISYSPNGNFMYAINKEQDSNSNQLLCCTISAFQIDAKTGLLKKVVGSPYDAGAEANSISINSLGSIAYVTHDYGLVTAYRINATTGTLTPIAESPVVPEVHSITLSINPAGTYAFGTNRSDSTISVYNIDADTGILSPIGGPFATGKNPTSFSIAQP